MIQIDISKIKTSEFQGTVDIECLSTEQLEALGINPNEPEVYQVEAIGEYDVEWDDDIPMVQVETVSLWNGAICLDLNSNQFDHESIEDEIGRSGLDSDWASDRDASRGDDAYDSYKDSLIE